MIEETIEGSVTLYVASLKGKTNCIRDDNHNVIAKTRYESHYIVLILDILDDSFVEKLKSLDFIRSIAGEYYAEAPLAMINLKKGWLNKESRFQEIKEILLCHGWIETAENEIIFGWWEIPVSLRSYGVDDVSVSRFAIVKLTDTVKEAIEKIEEVVCNAKYDRIQIYSVMNQLGLPDGNIFLDDFPPDCIFMQEMVPLSKPKISMLCYDECKSIYAAASNSSTYDEPILI